MLSIHFCFGLPLLLFACTPITITVLPTHFVSLNVHATLSYCLALYLINNCRHFFQTFPSDVSPSFVAPLILPFLILSSFVIPSIPSTSTLHPTSSRVLSSRLMSRPHCRSYYSAVYLTLELILAHTEPHHTLPVFLP